MIKLSKIQLSTISDQLNEQEMMRIVGGSGSQPEGSGSTTSCGPVLIL